MRNKLIAFVSGVVLGFAGLLSASAQGPPTEAQPAPTFEEILADYEARMDALHAELNATLPHEGPLTDEQLRLLALIQAPKPYEIAMASAKCLSGGSHSSLVTYVDNANKVTDRGEKTHNFRAKTGWVLSAPTVGGTGVGELYFDGYTSPSQRSATAEIADKYNVGDIVQTGTGLRGSGRIRVTCYKGNSTQTHSWGWTLFRDCPSH